MIREFVFERSGFVRDVPLGELTRADRFNGMLFYRSPWDGRERSIPATRGAIADYEWSLTQIDEFEKYRRREAARRARRNVRRAP